MELDSEGLDMDSPVKVIACSNETAEDYEVEKITGMRLVKNKLWFRVRWKGYGKDNATWEPRANLTHCEELLDDYVCKVQDKKYKQKKRRQTRNALVHTRKRETKEDVVKTKIQAFQGKIRRKRFIKKFISKPNKYFPRVPQTKWQMNGGQLEMVNLNTPEDLPLETPKEKELIKRGRGRPKKNSTQMPDLQPQTQLSPDSRAPLETDGIMVLDDSSKPDPNVETIIKRCKGTSRKTKIIQDGEQVQRDFCVQDRAKVLEDNSIPDPKEETVIKKSRGRPRKTKIAQDGERLQRCFSVQDRTKVLEDNSIPEPKVETVIKRSRGRPRKTKIAQDGERLQRDFCEQERTRDIVKKQRKPKTCLVDGGASKEATDHLWKGQIKLKRVVIRELRSLKALLEFQRQLSDEEKENLTDLSKDKPSSMEERHVHASEYHNRFYIRIKTGSFKDLSTKRRRKRKASKEKRRKKREAAMEEQTSSDRVKNELLDKHRGWDEEEESEDNGCNLPDVVEISSSEGECENGDSVESQTDAPSLNEEYDEFGYDDFFDFSKDNDSVGDGSKMIDAELPPALQEKERDGWEIQGDKNATDEFNNQQDKSNSNSRPEQLAEDDVVINDEKQEEMEEDEALADESSSLVIPFDEEEESSSLIIGDDRMEEDGDDNEMGDDGSDDEDDLREFGIGNTEIQEHVSSISTVFTADSFGTREKRVTQEMTHEDEECRETEHFEESTDSDDPIQPIFAGKCRSEDSETQQKEKRENNLNGTISSDFIREDNIFKILSKGIHGNRPENIATSLGDKDTVNKTREVNFSEDNSREHEKQLIDSQISSDEFSMDEEDEEERGTNSASFLPLEAGNAMEQFITEKDGAKLNEKQPMRASQTPVLGKHAEEEDAIKMINSNVLHRRNDKEADNFEANKIKETIIEKIRGKCNENKREKKGVAHFEQRVEVLTTEEGMMKESVKINNKEMNMMCTQKTTETTNVGKNHAIEVISSESPLEETDDDVDGKEEMRIDQREEGCKDTTEVERKRNDDLTEPPVTTLSAPTDWKAKGQADDQEMPSEVSQGLMEKDETEGNDLASPVPVETDNVVEESITEKDQTKLEDEGPIRADQLVESEEDCAVAMTKSETFPKNIDRKGGEACVEIMPENFNIHVEEIRESTEDFIEPPVTEQHVSKCKKLDGEGEVDDTKSLFAVAKETEQKEVKLEEEVGDKLSVVFHRAAKNPTQNLTITKETAKNDDQGEVDKENDEDTESGAQENRLEESKTKEEVELVKKHMPRETIEIIKPDVTTIREGDGKETDGTEGVKNEPVEEKGEPCCMERKEENNKEEMMMVSPTAIAIENIKVADEGEQEQRPTKTANARTESETAIALIALEKELALVKEVLSEKHCGLQRDNNKPNSTTKTKDTKNVEVDDQRDQQQRPTKIGDAEMESETAIALETIEKELALDEEVLSKERDSNEIKPNTSIKTKEAQNLEIHDQGEQQQKSTKTGDEEMESETVIALETIEKELALDEEVLNDKDESQRDSGNMKQESIINKETLEAEDQDEQGKKGTETGEEKMESEKPYVDENADREFKTFDKTKSENKLSQEDNNNVKLKVPCEREKEVHCDHGIKNIEEHIEEQMVEDETNSSKEMEFETVTPGKDETKLQEGDSEVDRVTKGEEEKIFTSSQEDVENKDIGNDEAPKVDTACNNGLEEAAVTVSKEQRLECGDNQDKDVKGTIDLLVKEVEDVGCEEDDERSLANSEREARATKESKEGGKETAVRERVVNDEEPAKLEVTTAKDNLHRVGAETKEQSDETNEKSVEKQSEDILESNCNKDHKTQDNENIIRVKTVLGNDHLKDKKVKEEVSQGCHDNTIDKNDALLVKKDVTEQNKLINPDIIDEKTADKIKNCNNSKQIPFSEKSESPKNRTTSNIEDIQEALPMKKMEADSDERRARVTGLEDGVKKSEEGELEEGEIPEVDEEEEKRDDIVKNKDADREEGEITDETEDIIHVEEIGRSDRGENKAPVANDGFRSIITDSVKVCSHSQKKESKRRRSQETFEIVETNKSNSDHRTTQRDGEKRRTTRSSVINMKRNFNGAYPTKDHKRSKTLDPGDPIALDDDNDDVEIVEHDVHPKKTRKTIKNVTKLTESDVIIIEEDCAKFAGSESADQTRTFRSEHHSKELSPKFAGGIKRLLPTSSSRVCKVDKKGSKTQKLVQSMKSHIQHTVSNTGESGKNGQAVIKNSACKAQGFKVKDSVCMDREENLFKRKEDADPRASRSSGTKRKSDDDDNDDDGDEGSKTRQKKKPVGASGKEVWQMVTRKEKKPTEPIWEGTPKINRQKIVIKISKKLLTDQPETKEPESNVKRKEPERSSSRNGWREAKRGEVTGKDSIHVCPDEQKEKQEKQSSGRAGMAASTSTGAVGRWSALPKAKQEKTRNDTSGTNNKHPSDRFQEDLKELKAHGIKQADLPWVRDLLETDHADCLSEACAALTKFMDSKDQKINLIVEMGFCPLLVKLLRSRSPAVISSALLAVSHIVSGNDYQTQAVLECSPLPLFCSFLSRNKYDVTLKKEACLALSNITAGTSQQIQHLVNDGLFPVLLSTMQHDEFQVMYEATWAVANATVNGSPEQIRYVVKQGFFRAFSEVLKHSDDTLVQIALDAMYNVLKLDTKPKKYGKLSPYCSQVKEYGGLERIRSVRMTGSTVVKKKAYNMLNSFFPDF